MDEVMAIDVMGIFSTLHLKGTTVVFATHDTDLIQRYSYRIISMSGGKKVDVHKDEEVKAEE